ncbi:hypothetical protein [Vibrio alginolyticus]|uniref:hypothetical protein n=1 Tax=Vibrio alginolyticus TaxID=663 RepID=UPI003F66E0E5
MELESKLEVIFSNTNDWLKFAEAKNIGLIALNGALLVGLLQSLDAIKSFRLIYQLYFLLIAICSSASCSVALISLIARLEAPWWLVSFIKNSKCEKDNLTFFLDISKYSGKQYLEMCENKYPQLTISCRNYCLHLAEQITSNAKISTIKYKQFNVALFLLLGGILTPLGLWVFSYIKQ